MVGISLECRILGFVSGRVMDDGAISEWKSNIRMEEQYQNGIELVSVVDIINQISFPENKLKKL